MALRNLVWSSADLPAEALRERIEQMHDNLRAALGWWMAEHRATEGLQLAITLCQFWISRGAYAETSPWLEPMRDLATGRTDRPIRLRWRSRWRSVRAP